MLSDGLGWSSRNVVETHSKTLNRDHNYLTPAPLSITLNWGGEGQDVSKTKRVSTIMTGLESRLMDINGSFLSGLKSINQSINQPLFKYDNVLMYG